MASIEYITKRIEGKKKEIAKLEKKIERINKAAATNWEVNPYYYSEDDLRYAKRDLQKAQEGLEKLEQELGVANDKAASRNVPAITEFLEGWKQKVREFYHKTADEYPKAYEQYKADLEPFKKITYFEERKMKKENYEAWKQFDRERGAINEAFKARYGHLEQYMIGFKVDWDRFENDIKNEADRKYDFIIERTNEIVKVITDASGLKVGDKGDLNGYIIGTAGTAKVQTIGAGGYNIQCFHFRTLINKV